MVPSNVTICRAEERHAYLLAPHLREADVDEVRAAANHSPIQSLLYSLAASTLAYAAVDRQGVIAVWGVGAASYLSDTGSPWLLASDRLVENPNRRAFLRESRRFVDHWRRSYDYLFNFVSVENTASLDWLRFCGFTIHPPAPHGPFGNLFHFFDWRKDINV